MTELLQKLSSFLERSNGAPLGVEEAFGLNQSGLAGSADLLEGAGFGLGAPPGLGGNVSWGVNRSSGFMALERIKRTRRENSGVIVSAGERSVMEDLRVLPGESWSWLRHAESELLPSCGTFATLKRVIVMVACALDEGRAVSLEAQQAFLVHVYRVLEQAAKEDKHDLGYGWPILGVPDPVARRRPAWAPAEAAALASYYRDEAALETARRTLGRNPSRPNTEDEDGKGGRRETRRKTQEELARRGREGKGGRGDGAPPE